MRALKKLLIIFLAMSFIFAIGCTKKTDAVTLGETKDGTYTNSYFNLKVKISEDWYMATKEEMDQLTNAGNQIVSDGDENLQKKLDLAQLKTLNLLFAFKYPLDYMDGVNSNFMCIAENLGISGISVKSGEQYLESAKKLMQQAGLPYEFSPFGSVKVGGKDFTAMDATIDLGDIVVTQRYYTAIIKGYAMNFILSFTTDEEFNQLKSILDSVTF